MVRNAGSSNMSIDLAQFHQVFFEESFEGLEVMESGLLNLDLGSVDDEEINTIFRAAHSIKGGSGTFGFIEISDFTHVMETLLDEMRAGQRQVSQQGIDVLLGAVDCLREMLSAIQNQQEVDQDQVLVYKRRLDEELNGAAAVTDAATEGATVDPLNAPSSGANQDSGWHIAFSPHLHMLKLGNEPLRMFRELEEMGTLTVFADDQGLPGLRELDAEECHLSWDLKVFGQVAKDDVHEIFDWVEDDCDLAIQSLAGRDASREEAKLAETQANVDSPAAPEANDGAKKVADKAVAKKKPKPPATKGSSSSIRVDTSKIDTLINMVGELVITQSMLSLMGEQFELEKLDQLKTGLAQLEQHTRELQESVMNIRMLPISFVFSRFPRLVHDLSAKLGKQIELKLSGEQTEVDKSVVELISDPLVHLIRNSIDHGIEMPQQRTDAGKPEKGIIRLKAFHRGGSIFIEVSDDGKGLDPEKLKAKALERGLITENDNLSDRQAYELIMTPGFSTAESVTDVSGRGVGMDVVRKNIQALGGNIEIRSELGKGSTMSISLPLTLAILDGQTISVGDETYIVPLVSIIESLNVVPEMINCVLGKGETFQLRGEYLPVIRMHQIFGIEEPRAIELIEGILVVVESQGVRCGLFVDDLLGQQQVVVKSLEDHYRRIEGVSGATILGDGSVALILDIPGLFRLSVGAEMDSVAVA